MINQSEVARLRERIDREVEALQYIKNGLVKVASHETIMRRYRMLDACYEKLVKHVGEAAALDDLCERMNTIK